MLRTLMFVVASIAVASPAFADADHSIKYRQNAMKAVGAQMGAIVAILKGEVDNKAALGEHAAMMGAATSTAITVPAFTENTDGKGKRKTTSLGAIWQDWDKFEAGLKELEKAGAAAAAAGANISFNEVKALGATCKGCHKAFREKK